MRNGTFLSRLLPESYRLKGEGGASQKMIRERTILREAAWVGWARGSVADTLLIGDRFAGIRYEAVKEEEGEEIIAWSI